METKKMRIGELAQHLNVEKFVIRYWEKEFGIRPKRSPGGQRYYSKRDLKKLETIRHLLHEKKFTIAGARKVFTYLNKHNKHGTSFTASEITSLPVEQSDHTPIPRSVLHQLSTMRNQLVELRNILDPHVTD